MKTTESTTSPGHVRRPRGRQERVELHKLQGIAVLLVGSNCAVGIQYETGATPMAVLVGRGKAAEDMIWYCHESSIPAVELPGLSPEEWHLFTSGEEIPFEAYKAVANALALVNRTRNSQELVRFLRPLSRAPRRLGQTAQALVEEFGSILDLPSLYVQCGNDLWDGRAVFEEAVGTMRGRLVLETGQPLAVIPFRNNPKLSPAGYRIIFKDSAADEGELQLPADSPEKVFPLVNRLRGVIARQGWEMLTYDQVEALLLRNRKEHPGLYRQLFPEHITVLAVRRILCSLLREGLSIRELTLILEVILEHLPFTQDADLLTELVRSRFARELSRRVADPHGNLPAIVLDVEVEDTLLSAMREVGGVRWLDATPDMALRVMRAIGDALKEATRINVRCALLVTPTLRRFLALMLQPVFEDLVVLAYNEVAPLTEVRAVAVVKFLHASLGS